MLAAFWCAGLIGLFRAPVGAIRDNQSTNVFLRTLVEDAIAVGCAEGILLPTDLLDKTMGFLAELPAGMKASMFEDLLAGNRLELQ